MLQCLKDRLFGTLWWTQPSQNDKLQTVDTFSATYLSSISIDWKCSKDFKNVHFFKILNHSECYNGLNIVFWYILSLLYINTFMKTFQLPSMMCLILQLNQNKIIKRVLFKTYKMFSLWFNSKIMDTIELKLKETKFSKPFNRKVAKIN